MTSNSPENNLNNNTDLASVFEWMPVCTLVIDPNGTILNVNQNAIHFFRATTKEDFIFDMENLKSLIVDSNQASELIRFICKNPETTKKTMLIRRFDKSITGIDLTACLFPHNQSLILIQFKEVEIYSHGQVFDISQTFNRESQKLKPYLNKPGKELLDQLAFKCFLDENNKPKLNSKVQSELINNEISTKLYIAFPQLSNNELIICGFLSLKLSIEDIASFTGKTPNSLRVSIHRILQKTNFQSGKELIRKLENITYSKLQDIKQ